MQLVDDAKDWWKFWSVRLSVIGGAILTIMEIYPNAISATIQALPNEVKSRIDPELLRVIGIACIISSPIARVIRQSKLENKGDQSA